MKPYKWQSVQATGEGPCARMYAAAAARADGLLLLCGGRDANNSPLVRQLALSLQSGLTPALQADVFGLARHRDGRWEWAAAPVVAPTPRYQVRLLAFAFLAGCVHSLASLLPHQHAVACIGARLHASGGALGGGKMVRQSRLPFRAPLTESRLTRSTAALCWTPQQVRARLAYLKADNMTFARRLVDDS